MVDDADDAAGRRIADVIVMGADEHELAFQLWVAAGHDRDHVARPVRGVPLLEVEVGGDRLARRSGSGAVERAPEQLLGGGLGEANACRRRWRVGVNGTADATASATTPRAEVCRRLCRGGLGGRDAAPAHHRRRAPRDRERARPPATTSPLRRRPAVGALPPIGLRRVEQVTVVPNAPPPPRPPRPSLGCPGAGSRTTNLPAACSGLIMVAVSPAVPPKMTPTF